MSCSGWGQILQSSASVADIPIRRCSRSPSSPRCSRGCWCRSAPSPCNTRRRRLVELANEHDVLIVEDTPYRPLRYSGDHLPTLKSLDTEGRVLHLGSFSKILAPGMRLGWAVAEPGILERLSLLKLAADTQSSTLNMAATSAYLARFDLDAHIARSCRFTGTSAT